MSMSVAVHNYRVHCTTEDEDVYVWGQEEPTACPNNNQHSINADTIVICNTVKAQDVELVEEKTPLGEEPTNSHFMVESLGFDIPAGQTVTEEKSWPYPISGLICYWTTAEEHRGDMFSCGVSVGTIGGITANVTAEDTVINVSSTVIQYTDPGYYITLTDGVNSEEHKVVAVSGNTLTFAEGTTHSYSAASPTYCQLMVYKMKDFEFGPPATITVGKGKIGGSYVHAGWVVKTTYTNYGEEAVRFVGYTEFLY